MTYDRRHMIIQWGGTLPGGEIWSCSMRGGGTGTGEGAWVPTFEDIEDWLTTTMKDAVAAYHSRPTTYLSNTCKLTFLKANVVDMNGHYTDPNTHEYYWTTPVAGGSAAAPHPQQVAWAVSLTTGLSRGLAHRGRFYLPMPVPTMDAATGLVQTAFAQACATSTKTFIEAVADTPGLDSLMPFKILVMSKSGTGATHPVTGVEVGRVLDTQRRRRNSLAEDYQAVVVDQGAD